MKKFRGFDVIYDNDGDEEEHEVEAMAIHPDETQLAYTTLFTSEIIFADFHGNKIRNVAGEGYFRVYREMRAKQV